MLQVWRASLQLCNTSLSACCTHDVHLCTLYAVEAVPLTALKGCHGVSQKKVLQNDDIFVLGQFHNSCWIMIMEGM